MMNEPQTLFIKALKAWNLDELCRACYSILVALGCRLEESSKHTKSIRNACKELLSDIANTSSSICYIDFPLSSTSIVIKFEYIGFRDIVLRRSFGLPEEIRFHFSLWKSATSDEQSRWHQASFTEEAITIPCVDLYAPKLWNSAISAIQSNPTLPEVKVAISISPRIARKDRYSYALKSLSKVESVEELLTHLSPEGYAKECSEFLTLATDVRDVANLPKAASLVRRIMAISKQNIETIIERLKRINYCFEVSSEDIFRQPKKDVLKKIAKLETRIGALPLSICAFYEMVGSVNLAGRFPEWETFAPNTEAVKTDYLQVFSIDEWFASDFEFEEDHHNDGTVYLEISIDDFTKAGFSGGGSYAIKVPNASFDALMEDAWFEATFIQHLRISFQWGGFPGLSRYQLPPNFSEIIQYLSQDLIPI
jgi:hypothetical protein